MANYSAAIFANEGGLSVGNGTNYTYHIFKFNDASRYHLAAFDISGKNSPVGRLDGKNQTITKNGGFESVTFTPMIGGGMVLIILVTLVSLLVFLRSQVQVFLPLSFLVF